MTSTNRVVQVVLVVVLAALCHKYLQLQTKYDELKSLYTACSVHDIDNIIANCKNGEFKSIQAESQRSSVPSVVMYSSAREDNTGKGYDISEGNGVELNEPTFSTNGGEQDVTLTLSNGIKNINGFVHQTSPREDVKELERTEIFEKDSMVTPVDSTNDIINPSTSSTFEIKVTQQDFKQSKLLSKVDKITSSQSKNLNNIKQQISQDGHKSTTVYSSMKASESIDSFNDGNVTKNDDTIDNHVTVDTKQSSQTFQDKVELMSSELTEEKKIFVQQTVLKALNEDSNVYNHFNLDKSTPGLDTGVHRDSFHHLMTSSTDYIHKNYDEVCNHASCQEKEYYEENDIDDEEFDDSHVITGKKEKIENSREITLPDYIITPDKDALHQIMAQGTSAWCRGETWINCQFQNICYNTKEKDFVFFKGENSILDIHKSKEKGDDSSIFDINLSTIHRHNGAMFSLVTLPISYVNQFSIGIVNKRSVAISRFKPDNIMHVLHDDVLPLFQTLKSLKYPFYSNAFDVAIIFTDSYDQGNYFELYSSLSTVDPISPWQHNKTYDLLCFPYLHIGLETSTIWYQYGFHQPQGPVLTWNENILQNIHKATDSLSLHLRSECPLCAKRDYLVFLSRKDNRLILNEGELIMAIAKSSRLKVMSVSLETHSLSTIITIVRLSRGIIGIHGSLLSLAMFLTSGSIVIELFPFAVIPSHYTPFKTFCDLPGSAIVYKSWANPSQVNSVPHPDRPANEGGIRHLPQPQQLDIVSQINVPRHLCCDDPSWLYHIYQDTIVDISAVVALVMDAMSEAGNKMTSDNSISSFTFSKDIPGSVRNLQCEKVNISSDKESKMFFVVSWDRPWVFDVDVTALQKHQYELMIQEGRDKDNLRRLNLPATDLSHQFESWTVEPNMFYNVWLRVVGNKGDMGKGKFIKCS